MPDIRMASVTAAPLVTTTETTILSLGPFTENEGQSDTAQGYLIAGSYNYTSGAGATALTTRVRQGSITGTMVGVARQTNVVAGNSADIPFIEQDPTFNAIGAIYVVTVQQVGATANGVVNRGAAWCGAVTSAV